MTPEIEQELYEKYPDLFAFRTEPYSPMAFGIECGSGWAGIIRGLCRILDGRESNVRFTQIKEKWGTLRIYAQHGDDGFVDGAIRMAEEASAHICEVCGRPGEVRRGGWISTLCDECHGRRG